jgi:hypothetical protein
MRRFSMVALNFLGYPDCSAQDRSPLRTRRSTKETFKNMCLTFFRSSSAVKTRNNRRLGMWIALVQGDTFDMCRSAPQGGRMRPPLHRLAFQSCRTDF